MGWQQNIFPLIIINSSGQFTGLFVYSPAPGAGNLIASIAGSSGTDPYGNAYQKGIASYGAGGAVTVISGSTTLVYAGTPAAGNLLASIAPAAGTDSHGNTFQAGVSSYNTTTGAVTTINGAVTIAYSGAPAGGTSDNMVASIAPANTTDSVGNTVQAGLAVYKTQGGVGLNQTIQAIGNIIQWISAVTGDKLVIAQDTTTNNLFIEAAGSATVPAIVETSDPAALGNVEAWHTFTLQNSFTAGTDINGTSYPPSYMMLPSGDVKLRGELIAPASGGVTNTTFAVIPAAYRPATNIPTGTIANNTGTQTGTVYIRPNGNVQLAGAFSTSSNIRLDCVLNVQGT